MEVAKSFCLRENISNHFVKDIVNFIERNTIQKNKNEHKEIQEVKNNTSSFPLFNYYSYQNTNYDAIENKFIQLVSQYQVYLSLKTHRTNSHQQLVKFMIILTL